MSKVIRTGQVSGRAVVTLGRHEDDLFFDPAAARGRAPTIDLEDLIAARVTALRSALDREWERRARQEQEAMKAAAEGQLAEAEARRRQEVEGVHRQRYEEGHADGVAAKENEAREAVERLAVLHDSICAERAQILLEAESLVVDLAAAVARRVTRVQAETDTRVVARTVRAALERLSEHSPLVVKVHRDDLQIARKFAAAWVERMDADAVLKIQVSDHVGRGGCMIEGGEENVDARLEPQLDVLQRALRDQVEAAYERAAPVAAPGPAGGPAPDGASPAAAGDGGDTP